MKKTAKGSLFYPVILPGLIIGGAAAGYFWGRHGSKEKIETLERLLRAYTGKKVKKSSFIKFLKDPELQPVIKGTLGMAGFMFPFLIGAYIGSRKTFYDWEEKLAPKYRKILLREMPEVYKPVTISRILRLR